MSIDTYCKPNDLYQYFPSKFDTKQNVSPVANDESTTRCPNEFGLHLSNTGYNDKNIEQNVLSC